MKNNYLKRVITKIILQRINNIRHGNLQQRLLLELQMYCKIPYIRNLLEKLWNFFCYPQHNFIIYEMKHIETDFMMKLKLTINFEQLSNVIYKIPCSKCDECYIVQIRRYLKEREHRNDGNHRNSLDRLNIEHPFLIFLRLLSLENLVITRSGFRKNVWNYKHKNNANKCSDIDYLNQVI